jgi:hypothetical protein
MNYDGDKNTKEDELIIIHKKSMQMMKTQEEIKLEMEKYDKRIL